MSPFMVEHLPTLMAGMASLGLSVALLTADPRLPTTRAIAAAFAANAVAEAADVALRYYDDKPSPLLITMVMFFMMAPFAAVAEWLLRVARTARPSERALLWIARCTRTIQSATLLYALEAIAIGASGFPTDKTSFMWKLDDNMTLLMFGVPLFASGAALTIAGMLLGMQRMDAAERIRAFALGPAMLLLLIGFLSDGEESAVWNLLGQLVFIVGAVRYQGIQGERGLMMSKFLSPEVEKLVRLRGLEFLMQPQALNITAVACDLRGFTRFSQTHPTEEVIALLDKYYAAVGVVVEKAGATIKDYAGDGILMLVGAPLSVAHHESTAVALARDVRSAVQAMLLPWNAKEKVLGVGGGLASGRVAAGGIGSSLRMEYTAVGPAVNLAARLCSLAADGEILVDAPTVEQAGRGDLVERAPASLKGFDHAVVHFSIPT